MSDLLRAAPAAAAATSRLLPDAALERLARWASQRAQQMALQHKRRGRWKAWSWADVAQQVETLGLALRAQGLGPGSSLALSGAFEPTLLLLALAAAAAGSEVVSLPPATDADALQRRLAEIRPSHLYLQDREGIGLALQASARHDLLLLSAQSVGSQQAGDRILPLAELHPVGQRQPHRLPWRRLHRSETVWCEGGTEWQDGLAQLLQHWLADGHSLAFPETMESAARDRRDIAPSALLLSPQRLHRLDQEIESRLAPPGSWRRRLSDWTLLAERRGLGRHLHARVRRHFGLQQLRTLIPVAAAGQSPAWVQALTREVA